jgi:TolB-like protein/Tfp pilus assembly protein PilF
VEKSTDDRIQSAQDLLTELRAIRRAWESGTVAPAPASGSDARPASSDLRVAVLPFTSRGSGDAEALAEGLTDDITAGLARFHHLRVVSRPEAEKAKGRAADASAAGAVGARFLMDGAVRTSGTAVRVTVRLVDTASQTHVWAENYDRTLSSDTLFTVQDDLASRIIATTGDAAGVLVRSMAAVLKDRDLDELSVRDLVLRFYAYIQTFRADEHLRLRTAFERALEREPNDATGWAILAQLYENEHSQQVNPLPQPLARCAQAAERAVGIDPACHAGWLALAIIHFFNRDVRALRMAGDRVLALNPLDTAASAYVGMMRAYAGDWDEGVALTRRAMDLNPHHPGWLYYVLATDHYRRGEYERTLLDAQRSNMPQFIWTPLCAIVAAGQLGRVEDARAGFDGLRKIDPRFLEADAVRHVWSQWTWDRQLLERLMDGFAKAKALVDGSGAASSQPMRPWQHLADRSASIAVMPFTDLSPAGDQEWFCDGMAEEILNALTPMKNLRVAARASAFSLRGKSDDLKTIGEKLNVTTVLSGSVRRAGDRVRITVQLSEVATGFQLWSDRYDRELRDIFDVQDQIAMAIADRLKVSLDDDPFDRLARLVERGTTDVEAYQRFLQARALLSRRGGNIAKSIELFHEAVALDPDYALAWAGIAEAHCMLVYYGLARGADSKAAAISAATRAIELEPSSAPGHASLAFAVLLFDQDLARAGREFERAIDLNPRYVEGRCWYALFYLQWTRGRFAEGVAHARRALEDDPLSAYPALMLAGCLQATGPLDEAIATGRLAVERDPDSVAARWVLGATLALAGRANDAVTMCQAAAAMTDSPVALSGLAFAYARAGRTADAAGVHEDLAARAATRYVALAFLASAAASGGRLEQALALARRAWDDREPTFMLWARHYHEYDRLRDDPRFQAILQEMDAASS